MLIKGYLHQKILFFKRYFFNSNTLHELLDELKWCCYWDSYIFVFLMNFFGLYSVTSSWILLYVERNISIVFFKPEVCRNRKITSLVIKKRVIMLYKSSESFWDWKSSFNFLFKPRKMHIILNSVCFSMFMFTTLNPPESTIFQTIENFSVN